VMRRLEQRQSRQPRPWITLGLARSRALLAAARGDDVAKPLRDLDAARDLVPVDVVPLDRARCLLVAGAVLRRTRRKAPARAALTAAALEFDTLGAAAFAERARSEAVRVGGRAPAAESDRVLTPTEERIARLAADGRLNREIAGSLFVSPKTVEANLARAYRKLGVSSRAQLAAALLRRATPDSPASPPP
jgi:DNA-binding CsgD family transcriptional regulator